VRNRSRTLAALALGWMAALGAGRIEAQFDQYRTPGGPTGRPESRKKALENAVAAARWRLGPVHAEPWVGVKNVDYIDNALGTAGKGTGDLTATAGAGLRAYLRTGPKLIWAAHALPEYVWWRDLADRRRLDGRYGVGAFGFGNHLTFEATAVRQQEQQIVTPEVLQTAHARTDTAELGAEVPLGGAFSLFGSAVRQGVRNLGHVRGADPREVGLANLAALDRDETLLTGGLRWNLPRRWSLGLGVQSSAVDFVQRGGPFDRSNSGTSPLAELKRDAPDLYVSVQVARRSLAPRAGASFTPYHGATVNAAVGLRTEQRLSFWLYGSRDLIYSLAAGYSYLRDDQAGVAVQRKLGWRTSVRAFGEAGRQGYTASGALAAPDRRDTSRSYGAQISFNLPGIGSALTVRATRTAFRSNLPGLDRAITSAGAGVSFGGTGTWY
jgi:hypothetical protein